MACLLERLVQVEEGGGQGGKRRLWARQEEERARLDRESCGNQRSLATDGSRQGRLRSESLSR